MVIRILICFLLAFLVACLPEDAVPLGSGYLLDPQETRSPDSLVVEAGVYPGFCPIGLVVDGMLLDSWQEPTDVRREIRAPGAESLAVEWVEVCP